MGSDWQEVDIASLAAPIPGSMAVGPFGSRMKADLYTPDGVRIIRGNNLGDGKSLKGGYVFVPPAIADSMPSCCLKPGDLVFPHRGNIGEVGLVPEDSHRYMLSTSLMKLSPDRSKADPLFLFYFFKSTIGRQALLTNASQVGTPGISTPLKSLKEIRLPLPDLSSQRCIIEVLSALDDKIALLRKTNATLEAIAQALFKSWFVDFDPVSAKAEGRDPEGVPPEVADLFPSESEDSELGVIPKGWRARSVDEEFNLVMGQSPPGNTYNEEGNGVPFFQGRTDFGFRFPTNRMYCSAPTRFALPGDTLVSVRAPVGDINMALERCCIGRGVASIRHKSGALSFTFYAMRAEEKQFAHFESDGTVFGCIGKKDFHALRLVVPPPDVIEAFESFAGPLDERVKTNESEIGSLITLRDTLLPRLMSGKLRVGESQVEAL